MSLDRLLSGQGPVEPGIVSQASREIEQKLPQNNPTTQIQEERKIVAIPPGRTNRLFDRKVEGKKEDSPEEIKKAYSELFRAIQELKRLPPSMQSRLKIPDEKTLNFNKIHHQLELALIDEEFCRRLKGLGIIAGTFIGGNLAIRGLTAGLYYVVATISPDFSGWCTPREMADFGWQVSKWPALIFSTIASCISGAFCCTKGDTEENLIMLQKLIDESVKHIQNLERELKERKQDQNLSEDGVERRSPTFSRVTSTQAS